MGEPKRTILVVDDEPNMAWLFEQSFSGQFSVLGARHLQEALDALGNHRVDLVMLDLQIPGTDGMGILREIKVRNPEIPVIMMTAYATVRTAVEAIKAGAFDYILKPFDLDELRLTMEKALEFADLRQEVRGLRDQLKERRVGQLLAVSPRMTEVLRLVEKVGPSDACVLILGESGTGKELVARAIHQSSPRASRPFVAVNCAALPENLLESELFGHEKGAFTGAHARKPGRFEMADRGTILLDEIGDMPLLLQAKLLRVLEEKAIQPLGATRQLPVDVRILAATNRDLRDLVKKGAFREDLFFRLSVIPLHLPPLRERPEDIPLLANHFLKEFNDRHGKGFRQISPEAIRLLAGYSWPGNVRELRNVIEQVIVLNDDRVLLPGHLPPQLAEGHEPVERPRGANEAPVEAPGEVPVKAPVEALMEAPLKNRIDALATKVEAEMIRDALARCGGNRTRAAEMLKISRRTLQLKMKALGLRDE